MSENTQEIDNSIPNKDYTDVLRSLYSKLPAGESQSLVKSGDGKTEVFLHETLITKNGGGHHMFSIDITTLSASPFEIKSELGLKAEGLPLTDNSYEIQRSLEFEDGERRIKGKFVIRTNFTKGLVRINPVGDEKKEDSLATIELDKAKVDEILNNVVAIVDDNNSKGTHS